MPAIGTAWPSREGSQWPNTWLEANTCGSTLSGTRSRPSRVWSQRFARMSKSIVREAFVTSVACTCPPVSFHSSQLSMVPKASSPCAASAFAPGTWSRSQRTLVAEKYESTTSPVVARIASA